MSDKYGYDRFYLNEYVKKNNPFSPNMILFWNIFQVNYNNVIKTPTSQGSKV